MLGIPLTLAVARVAGHLSPTMSQFEPSALLAALAVVLISTGIAVGVPVARVGRINPIVVLRTE
jgi:ABC-type antimicrobial peptide transport system permease subunit